MRFRLSHSFLPDAERVLNALSLDSEVEGSILNFSDSGSNAKAFALVEVVRRVTVVVPSNRLESAEIPPRPD